MSKFTSPKPFVLRWNEGCSFRIFALSSLARTTTMDRNTALALLGVEADTTHEDLMECLDAEAFSVRDHFIRQPVVPALFRGRVNRLVQLSDISHTLGIDPLGSPVALPELLPLEGGALGCASNHLENLLRLRTSMAGTLDPDVLARFGTTMATLQVRYMEAFLDATADWPLVPVDEDVPAREECEWQDLLQELREAEGRDRFPLVSRERNRMQRMLDREVAG
jgi:hypothetical protein